MTHADDWPEGLPVEDGTELPGDTPVPPYDIPPVEEGSGVKILGKEPALIVGIVVAAISLGGTLGFRLLGEDQAGLWIGFVNALAAAIMAWTVRPLSPAVYTYLVSTIIALGAGYGLTLTDAQVSGINGLVVPILTLITRNQVSPIPTALTKITRAPTPEAAKAAASGPAEG